MKTGPQIALAVGIGYALGRSRKMKLAITVAGMLAGRRLSANPKELLERGGKLIEGSPAISKLTGEVRQNLMNVAKAAALNAASSKIDSVGENLTRRAESLRSPTASLPSQRGREDEDEQEEAKSERRHSDAEAEQGSDERSERRKPERREGARSASSKATSGSARERMPAARTGSARSSGRTRGGGNG
jgi:hypothetical protein